MRSDTTPANYRLGTSQSSSGAEAYLGYEVAPTTYYLGIRVYHVNASTTEITAGTAVAIASGSSSGLKSATWNYPQTNCSSDVLLRIVVYSGKTNPPTSNLIVFDTEILGAQSIDASTWWVYYYLYCDTDGLTYWEYSFYFGIDTYDSKIAFFKWTAAPPSPPTIGSVSRASSGHRSVATHYY